MSPKAKFVLSLDCELLWGSYDGGGIDRFPYLRDGFEKYYDTLLSLFEFYDIKVTFAFVGAVGLRLPEFEKLIAEAPTAGGYRQRLQKMLLEIRANERLWLAPDIIEKVVSSPIKHEIGSHSLTHLHFDSPLMSQAAAKFEFRKSHAILSRYAADVHSFIFPANRICCLREFQSSPFKLYRSKDANWYRNLPGQSLMRLADQATRFPPRQVTLGQDSFGNLHLPGSLLLYPFDGPRKLIPMSIRREKIQRGINQAIKNGQVFHLWFHPWNLGSSPAMSSLVASTLAYVREKIDQGSMENSTMAEVLEGQKEEFFQPQSGIENVLVL